LAAILNDLQGQNTHFLKDAIQ